MNSGPKPVITVAICTFNRYDRVSEAIDSVLSQETGQSGFELLVVDNSDDAQARDAFFGSHDYGDAVRVVYSHPPGLSRARNEALARCSTPYIAFLDDDALAEPGWLAGILGAFAEDDGVGVVAGPIEPIWPDGRPAWLPKSLEPTLTILDHGEADIELPSWAFAYGANMAFRTDLLRAAGGFGDQLGRKGSGTLLSCEELPCQDHIRREGYAIRYAAKARVRHHVHPDRLRPNWFRSRMAWQAVSEALENPPRYDRTQVIGDFARLVNAVGVPGAMCLLLGDEGRVPLERQAMFIRCLVLVLLFAQREDDDAYARLLECSSGIASRDAGDAHADALDGAGWQGSEPGAAATAELPAHSGDEVEWRHLNAVLQRRDAAIAQLSQESVALQSTLAQRTAEVDALSRESATLRAVLGSVQAQLGNANAMLDHVNATLGMVIKSTSWRITYPLRFAARLYRAGVRRLGVLRARSGG